MKERNPQDEQGAYFNWRRIPENNKRLLQVWTKEWEGEYWIQDKPKQPLTPDEQERIDNFYSAIINALKARHIEDGVARERAASDWGGTSAFLRLYQSTDDEDRTAIIRAMGKVIENAEQHPEISAQVIDIVTSMGLTQVGRDIKELSRKPIAKDNEPLGGAIDTYKATRVMDTFTYERSLEIYRRLTTVSPQTSQQ